MHLGNGVVCPISAIVMFGAAGVGTYFAFRGAKKEFCKDKVFYAITLTCLVFALHMINFSIPQAGSSGHIIGALLLCALLGANSAFLAICAILTIQALFFSDGGLLALGCNIVNMGVMTCFVAYPFIYKPLEKSNKPFLAALLASIVALQLGALMVVLEGVFSGSIAIHLTAKFCALMQFIHLPIGVVEGCIQCLAYCCGKKINYKKMSAFFGFSALTLAAFIAQYASQKPDGLEWSLMNIQGDVFMQVQNKFYLIANMIQNKTAFVSNMPFAAANLFGILAVGLVMYFICLFILPQGEKISERKV